MLVLYNVMLLYVIKIYIGIIFNYVVIIELSFGVSILLRNIIIRN